MAYMEKLNPQCQAITLISRTVQHEAQCPARATHAVYSGKLDDENSTLIGVYCQLHAERTKAEQDIVDGTA